jgi:tetratricopeptide (TPR) repeat protein
MARGTEPERAGEPREAALAAPTRTLYLFVGFAALGLAALRPALHGPPVSDDFIYIVYNPYLTSLSAANVLAILDPWGPVTANTVNYAPVHLLLHALEVQVFGRDVLGFHVVNVLVHALNSVLLVALLRASRVPVAAAVLGGALFTVHPANVEAVAWICQLKSSAALALSLGALVALRRHPALATLLFALALLTKASAAFALPMAAALTWAWRDAPEGARRRWAWLALWALLLALYAVPQLTAFQYAAAVEVSTHADPWVRARTIAAIGMRYLVMATTSYGVSAFHEPRPALSAFDPWWLASLPVVALLAWRAITTLRRRSEEAACWVGAAAAFGPVSQIFPFIHPMADRYLYFILPGLIGGAILCGGEIRQRLTASPARSGARARWRAGLDRAALVSAVLLIAFFGLHANQRAGLWRSEKLLFADAARSFPDGGTAYFLKTLDAIERGDEQAALAALRAAVDRGYDKVRRISEDAALEPIRDTPGFREIVREIAGRRIAFGRERGFSSQAWLHSMALAHRDREEYAEAAEMFDRAIRAEGPFDRSKMIADLLEMRRRAARARREEDASRAGD